MIINLQIGKDNKILRTKSQKVTDFNDPELKKFISDIKETLASIKEGAGLAAPQVGKNIRLFVLSPEVSKGQTVFINPKISTSFKKSIMNEACLSLPQIQGRVKRSVSAKIEAFDENGKKFKLKAEGLLAQAFQHEVDHLNGILFIDKTKELYVAKKEK